MTRAEREAFLAGAHVGVLGLVEPDGNALAVPIWYGYEPGGDVVVITGTDSRKGRALDASNRFSLCAQTEDAPYKYVSVTGPVVERRAVGEEDRRSLAHRYLGAELGDAYVAATADHAEGSTLYVLRPERWMTVDYNKEFG
jgi:PPOX class probable F420-dependent enzyme